MLRPLLLIGCYSPRPLERVRQATLRLNVVRLQAKSRLKRGDRFAVPAKAGQDMT